MSSNMVYCARISAVFDYYGIIIKMLKKVELYPEIFTVRYTHTTQYNFFVTRIVIR